MTKQEALLVLNAIPGLSGTVLRKLDSVLGNVEEVLNQQESDLLGVGLNPALVTNIIHFPRDKFLTDELACLKQLDATIITIIDDAYPVLLKEIAHPPLVLYVKGNPSLFAQTSIALVGSRKASSYGLKVAEDFSRYIAKAGIQVVSGGAYGIDTSCHQAALKVNGQTTAVLGSGLNQLYPKENIKMFEKIAETGLLVSEFPLNTIPIPYNFPRRNRIISGLSLATIVIEANERSGSLITAEYALDQNREVYAVPGNLDNVYSQGTNRLIKEGAKMALSAKEVLEDLGHQIAEQLNQEASDELKIHLSEEEYKIYQLINQTPQHIDIISSSLGQPLALLMGQMLNLELKGVIKQLPGQYFVRN